MPPAQPGDHAATRPTAARAGCCRRRSATRVCRPAGHGLIEEPNRRTVLVGRENLEAPQRCPLQVQSRDGPETAGRLVVRVAPAPRLAGPSAARPPGRRCFGRSEFAPEWNPPAPARTPASRSRCMASKRTGPCEPLSGIWAWDSTPGQLADQELLETLYAAVLSRYLLLARGLDHLHRAELFLRNIGKGDGQAHRLGAHDSEATAHQDAVGRVHGLIEQVLGAGWTVADIDGLPAGAACRASVQFRLRRIAAPPAAEHPVRALLLRPQSVPWRNTDRIRTARPDPRGSRASLFRVVVSLNRQDPITSDTAADLCTIGTAPAYPSCETCQFVVERATRLQKRPGLDRTPCGDHTGRSLSWSCISLAVGMRSTCVTLAPGTFITIR